MKRRDLLASAVTMAVFGSGASAETIIGHMPYTPGQAAVPPLDAGNGPATIYLTPAEADTVGAIADRLIPADDLSIGAREAGVVRFIDRQLAGPYGRAATQYRFGPFVKGTPEQGQQSPFTPAERYRVGLAALDEYTRAHHGGSFASLPADQQDSILTGLETGKIDLGGKVGASELFEQILQNVREGFLSDPIYGGNKDLVSWKMLGFPGAYYDYRDMIGEKGKRLNLAPTSLVYTSL